MIDETTEAGARAARRLHHERIGWLTTVTPAGQPQSSPIWFLREGDELVVLSRESPRVANIRGNPRVAFNLDSDGLGGEILTIEGEARIVDPELSAATAEAYAAKYAEALAEYGWTLDSMRRDYPVVIRIRPSKARLW